jgi:hypothetical protein
MIRIAISQAAFEAIARTLPFGSVSYENKTAENGDRLIWLERRMLDKLRSYRRAGESTIDVILRLARTREHDRQKGRSRSQDPRVA